MDLAWRFDLLSVSPRGPEPQLKMLNFLSVNARSIQDRCKVESIRGIWHELVSLAHVTCIALFELLDVVLANRLNRLLLYPLLRMCRIQLLFYGPLVTYWQLITFDERSKQVSVGKRMELCHVIATYRCCHNVWSRKANSPRHANMKAIKLKRTNNFAGSLQNEAELKLTVRSPSTVGTTLHIA